MTPLFLGLAALLSLLALAVLLRPLLWRRGARPAASRRALNTAIYRDQLDELQKDRLAGDLAEGDFDQAQQELQRRLLEDAQTVDVVPVLARPAWQGLVLLAVALPTVAFVTYLTLGNPRAQQEGSAPTHDVSAGEVDKMVAALAAKLEKNPGDLAGWAMLARSYKAMGRFDDAASAFDRVGKAVDSDPTLLAEYADLLAVRSNSLEGKPMQLVQKALQLDPNHLMALSLAGTAAYNRNDFGAALRYWEHLYKLLPADSPDAQGLAATLEEVRSKAGVKSAPLARAAAPLAPAAPAAVASPGISGEVTLDAALKGKVQPDDVLFVFARPASGGRMPLAVVRARARDLPLAFTLDDSQALSPDAKLSSAAQVKIEALVSKSGTANPGPGDLVGESAAVTVGAKGVRVRIGSVAK